MSNENITIKEGNTAANSFIFKLNDIEEPIIVINETGFLYRGELVEDVRHKIWAVQWHPERMESMNNVYPLNKLR